MSGPADGAGRGRMPHMLIDRFRFDSFAPASDEAGSNLLTRFGAEVFMFFMITPPHETVERAWERGLRVGRYKSLDDLLYHNVEAFDGMPELFFTWAPRADKVVRYEFLLETVQGRPVAADPALLAAALARPATGAALAALFPDLCSGDPGTLPGPAGVSRSLDRANALTLGRWGDDTITPVA